MSESSVLLSTWLELPDKGFSRKPMVNSTSIQCDCSGLISLLCDRLFVPKPYALEKPRAVHYFAILQEIGTNHISQVKPGNLMAWRKENIPKSGDSGHVLLVSGVPERLEDSLYRLEVIDSTKVKNGLSRRKICLHTNAQGSVIGVQLHLSETKVKRCPIYHAPLLNSRYCLGCGVPKKVCLCHQVKVNRIEPSIIILRHPDERKKTLSTVSLIKQRYPEVLVKEGEIFSPIRNKQFALLFPDADLEVDSVIRNAAANVTGRFDPKVGQQSLILLDATWRKAKRMLHENAWLAALPRVSIQPGAVSDYLLRKVPSATALSTVEVFAIIQNDTALQTHFRLFINKQIELMGKDKYESNYQDYINYTPLVR
ncbi:MAG: DTW domain-containing protein YfiP [Candidatus Azotimanducaceae bacterium]